MTSPSAVTPPPVTPPAVTPPAMTPQARTATVEQVTEALREVIDPDLGVNIVDMGFVRAVELDEGVARLTMTLTSPACPLTGVMEDQIRTALVGPLVRGFCIAWIWKPAWTPALVTPEGREQLQAIGFTF